MPATAFQRQYRQEFIHGFEDRLSRLGSVCTRESNVRGNEAIFLVADSGAATANNRGVDGLIPARGDNQTQTTCTILEYHDLVRKTEFNILSSQGDQRRMMQETSMAVINRRIDNSIIAALDGGTNNTGAAAQASLDQVIWARTILGNNQVDITDEDNMFAVVSPAYEGYLMQIPEYASADYVEVKPFVGPARAYRRWAGFNWICHPRLTNSVGASGTGASEQCHFFHRNAIGLAVHKDNIDAMVGFDDEQAYSWARTSVHLGAVLLQNNGLVVVLHDASGYAAT